MAEDTQRDKVKNHLEAARDWLGSASGALDKKEDVKSELDLMLAEAELTRAREMKNSGPDGGSLHSSSRLIRRVLQVAPLLAALAVAAVWLKFTAVTVPVKPTPPTPPTVARPTVPQAANPKEDKPEAAAPGSGAATGAVPEKTAPNDGERNSEGIEAPVPGKVTGGKQPQDETEDKSAGQSGTGYSGAVPDASTQQMMLDAAKILRQTK
ncbi:MAG: hypothetical protein Q4D07_09035 [Selenomonadaceae bacterium]|nr:hypothetical protein [Selenomonadaceae bacterium]